jgi:DNA-binding transcriptional regulator YdaS (Cro superfamily)
MLEFSTMANRSISRTKALSRALKAVGGPAGLARPLGVSIQAVSQWDEVPPLRVLAVERVTGVPRHELRPDLYPAPSEANA